MVGSKGTARAVAALLIVLYTYVSYIIVDHGTLRQSFHNFRLCLDDKTESQKLSSQVKFATSQVR